ncbi:MAG: glycine cleavage system protein GcvH [Trueperaceae bacterium]|jgi:glycine cleavage system H protein
MNIPHDVLFDESHEWVRRESDDTVTVGISDYAQDQLGDVVFVELPEAGAAVSKGDQVAVIESVKTASDIYTPVSGTIVEVNGSLETTPEQINEAPYQGGWIFRVKMSDPAELDTLLSGDAYQALTEGE